VQGEEEEVGEVPVAFLRTFSAEGVGVRNAINTTMTMMTTMAKDPVKVTEDLADTADPEEARGRASAEGMEEDLLQDQAGTAEVREGRAETGEAAASAEAQEGSAEVREDSAGAPNPEGTAEGPNPEGSAEAPNPEGLGEVPNPEVTAEDRVLSPEGMEVDRIPEGMEEDSHLQGGTAEERGVPEEAADSAEIAVMAAAKVDTRAMAGSVAAQEGSEEDPEASMAASTTTTITSTNTTTRAAASTAVGTKRRQLKADQRRLCSAVCHTSHLGSLLLSDIVDPNVYNLRVFSISLLPHAICAMSCTHRAEPTPCASSRSSLTILGPWLSIPDRRPRAGTRCKTLSEFADPLFCFSCFFSDNSFPRLLTTILADHPWTLAVHSRPTTIYAKCQCKTCFDPR